jgi:hypothetical protein
MNAKHVSDSGHFLTDYNFKYNDEYKSAPIELVPQNAIVERNSQNCKPESLGMYVNLKDFELS